MAHNRSLRRILHDVLTSPASQFTAHFLEVDCGGPVCARGRVYQVAGLVGVYRPETVAEMVRRLRCSVCGGGVVRVTLWSDPPARRTLRTRRLVLVGSEATEG